MAGTDWKLKGQWIKNCNCAFGCPCDFNARPTHEKCEGMAGMAIKEGYFGAIRLDGLNFAVTYHWPGPLHEGNGTLQAIVDERATEEQRTALLTILSGRESAEGTMFHIFSLIVSNVLRPLFAPIHFECDQNSRRARVSIPGILETESTPIRNPVTGAEHRVRIVMPDGFEHREAEIASARTVGTGAVTFDIPEGHSTLALVTQTPAGVAP